MNKLSDITLVDNTINPYERVRNLVKGNEHYNADLWEWARNESQDDFNAYISALTSNKLPSLQALNDKWAYSSVPESNKIFMLSVASNKDALSNEETRKKRTYDIYDAEGKVTDKKDLGELTDYEYYDTIFSLEAAAHNEYQRQVDLEQWKQDRGWLYNALTDVAVVIGDFAIGFIETFSGFFEVIADIGQTLHYVGNKISDWYSGNNSVNLEEKLRNVWGNEQLIPTQQLIQEYNEGKKYYTTLVDIWGGQSFWAQTAESTAQSIGNIVGAVAVSLMIPGGSAPAGTAWSQLTTAQKLAKTVHGATYFGTMFERSVQGSVAKDINHEHSIYEIMAVQGAETAFEWASEKALGNLLGFTRTGALTLGEKQTGMLIKNPLARFMINAVKEGSEEVVQEFGDWIITSIADAWTGKNNFYSDPMTFERMAQSFLAGFLTESVLSGVNAVATKVKETKWVNEFINAQNDYDVDTKTGTIFAERDKFKVELDNVKKDYAEGKPLNVVNDLGDPVSIEKGGYLYGDVNNAEHSYDALYNKKISEIETKYNDFVKQSDEAQARIDERVQNRRITFESASGKQKHEFKHGILGLFNALQMLNDYTWKLGNDKRSQKLASWLREIMNTGFQTISSLYGEMGSKAFADFTQLIAKFEINDAVVVEQGGDSAVTTGVNAMKFTVENAISIANDLISKYQIDKETAKKAESVIKHTAKLKSEAAKNNEKVKNVEKTEKDIINGMIFDNKEKTFKNAEGKSVEVSDDKDANQKAVDNASELSDKGLAVCVKTEGDTNVFADRFGVIIPIQNITDSVDAILTSAGLNNNIFATSADSHLSPAMRQQIVDEFNDINSTGIDFTFEDILKIMLGTNNSELLTHVLYLSDIETVTYFANLCEKLNKNTLKSMVGDNDKNPVALSTVSSAKQIVNNLLPALIEYAQTQPIKDSNLIGAILRTVGEDSAAAKQIKIHQYNFMLAARIKEVGIDNVPEKERTLYKQILETRLRNYRAAPGLPSVDKVREGLYSDKKNERKRAFDALDTYYNFIYSGVYNNRIYMDRNSSKNIIFNSWLKKNNLTIAIILDKNVSEQNILMQQFKKDNLGRYAFEFTMDENKPIKIIDLKPQKIYGQTTRGKKGAEEGQEAYNKGFIKIANKYISYHTISYKPVNEIFAGILKSKDDINNAFLTTNNLVDSPEDYIADDLLKKIEKKYGAINRDIVYEFLNAYLVDEYNGSMGIVPNQNNDLVLVEYSGANNFFSKNLRSTSKTPFDLTKYKSGKIYSISEFIDKSKLIGNLANVKVKISTSNEGVSNYNATTNTITILPKYFDNVNLFRFNILHEFNHAVDYYNGLNQGMNFIDAKDIPDWIAKDIADHIDFEERPDAKELSYWLYYATGAEFAVEGIEQAYTKYPAIRTAKNGVDTLITSWGEEYTLRQLQSGKQAFVKDGFYMGQDCSTEWNNICDKIIAVQGAYVIDSSALNMRNFNNLDFAFLLPNGKIVAGFDKEQNHIDIKRNLQKQIGFGEDFVQSIIDLRTNNRVNAEINEEPGPRILYATIGGGENADLRFTDEAISVLRVLSDFAHYNNIGFTIELYYNDDAIYVLEDNAFNQHKNAIERFVNGIYNKFNIQTNRDNVQARIDDYDDKQLTAFTKANIVSEQAYKDAQQYLKNIERAKVDLAKKEFNKKKYIGVPDETLKALKDGTYSSATDKLLKAAERIVRIYDKRNRGINVRAERKERGETYQMRNITKSKAEGTAAMYYYNNGKYSNYRPKLTVGMLNFLYALDEDAMQKIDKELSEWIRVAQPSQDGIFDYIRNDYKNINEYTFNLFIQSFFPNSKFKTKAELLDFIQFLPNLYALNSALKEVGLYYDITSSALDRNDYAGFMAEMIELPGVERAYKRVLNNYPTIDDGQAALSALKYYDGSLNSVHMIAGTARYQAKGAYKSRGETNESLNAVLSGANSSVDKDTEMTEIIGSPEDKYELADRDELEQRALAILGDWIYEKANELNSAANEAIRKAEIKYGEDSDKVKQLKDKLHKEQLKLQEIMYTNEMKIKGISPNKEDNWSKQKIVSFLIKYEYLDNKINENKNVEQEMSEFDALMQARKGVEKSTETARSSVEKYLKRNIERGVITDYTYDLLSDDVKSYIIKKDKRYSINIDAFKQLKTVQELEYLHEKIKNNLRVISATLRKVRAGKTIDNNAIKVVKESQQRTATQVRETEQKLKAEERAHKKTKAELAEEQERRTKAKEELADVKQKLKEAQKEIEYTRSKKYAKAILDANKTISYETLIPRTKITVKSKSVIPPILYKMFNVVFTSKEASKIQALNIDDEINDHTVISATEFFKQTANLWTEITEGDVQRIVDFIKTAQWGGEVTLQEIDKVKSLSNLILYSLLEWDAEEHIDLTDAQRQEIKDIIYFAVSNGARAMQHYGELLKRTQPWRTVANQLKYELGIEINDDDWELGQEYLRRGEFDKFEKLTQKIRDSFVEKYKDDMSQHRALWIANQMIMYMRAAMLSAPKTIIRNKISNYSITALRKISEPVGNQVAKFALAAQNFFRQKKGLEQINGYREGQVDLSKKINWSEHDKLNGEIDNFFQSAVMALFHDNITKYDIFEETEEAKAIAGTYWQLRIDQLRRSVQQEMLFDPRFIKHAQKIVSKLGFAYNFKDANDKLGFIEFVMRMQSDDQFIDKRAKEIFKRLLIEEGSEADVLRLIELAKQADADPYSMLMTDDIFVRLLSKAYGQAGYEYMHRPSFFGAIANYLNKNYPFLGITYRLMLPFIAGGFLWWQEANKYTPWHLVKSLIDFWRLDKKITTNESIYEEWQSGKRTGKRPMFAPEFTEYNIRTDLGKGIVGTVAIILASVLASLGFIIKDDDDDKYKFNFGAFTVDVSSLFGMDMFSTGAAFAIATKNREGVLDVLDAALSSTFENFFLSDIINQMRYNKGISDYFVDKGFSIIGSFIPNFYKAALRATNRYKIKYDEGIKGDLQYLLYELVPFAFLMLPKKIDPYTGDLQVRNTDSVIVNILNELAVLGGITIKTDMPSKLEKELLSINSGIGNLAGKYEDVGQLNFETLNTVYGKLNDRLLNELINDKVAYEVTDKRTNKKVTRKYSQMTAEQKQEVVSRIKTKNAKYAKIYTWTSEGHKYYGTLEEKKELAKLGIATNVYIKTNKLNGFVK